LTEDLKRFKQLTQQTTVIMGRKTYESIGKPLPKRRNIVVSKTMTKPEGVELEIVSDISKAIALCDPTKLSFIIGGSTIYAQTFDVIDTIYLTQIDKTVEGDAWYPEIPKDFTLVETEAHEGYSFLTYKRPESSILWVLSGKCGVL
jgi:dihydrofolate reductase